MDIPQKGTSPALICMFNYSRFLYSRKHQSLASWYNRYQHFPNVKSVILPATTHYAQARNSCPPQTMNLAILAAEQLATIIHSHPTKSNSDSHLVRKIVHQNLQQQRPNQSHSTIPKLQKDENIPYIYPTTPRDSTYMPKYQHQPQIPIHAPSNPPYLT